MGGIPLFPEQASTFAADVDALYIFIIAVSAFFTVAVSAAVLFFAIKYRRRHPDAGGGAHRRVAPARAGVVDHPDHHLDGHVRLGRASSTTRCGGRPPRRCRSTPSASSGCGNSSTPADSARSTNCTSRPDGRSRCWSRPRTSFTTSTFRPSAPRSTPSPAATRRCGSRPPSLAGTTSSAPNTAERNIPA